MRTNRFIYNILLLSTAILFNMSCSSDDDATDDGVETPAAIVTTEDFSLTVEDTKIADGDVLGSVTGTSNQGSVSFELTSQSPAGAMSINTTNGELSVADVSKFVVNEQVTGVVTVTKDAVTKTANIAIDVIPLVTIICDTPLDTPIDLSAFRGDLVISNINTNTDTLESEVQGEGDVSNECGIVELTGDVIGGFCDVINVVTLNLVPTDATTGTFVIEENTPYSCFEEDGQSTNTIQGTGTYDLATSTMTIDYTWYQVFFDTETGELLYDEAFEVDSGRTIITPGIADPDAGSGDGGDGGDSDYEIVITDPAECAGTVDTSMWEGNLIFTEDYEGDLYEYEVTGVAGDTCTLALNGDLIGFDCISDYVIHFIPESEGATTGTIIADEQLYDCDDEDGVLGSLIMTGTYDLTAGELILDYQYLDNGMESFTGQLVVTLAP